MSRRVMKKKIKYQVRIVADEWQTAKEAVPRLMVGCTMNCETARTD